MDKEWVVLWCIFSFFFIHFILLNRYCICLCIYVYVCECLYIYIYIYIYMYMLYVHMYTYVCMSMLISSVFVYVYMGFIFVCIYLGLVFTNEHVWAFIFCVVFNYIVSLVHIEKEKKEKKRFAGIHFHKIQNFWGTWVLNFENLSLIYISQHEILEEEEKNFSIT